MRVLFINQFFWPDAAATGQFLADVTRELTAQGHQVEVLCGRSSYAAVDAINDAPLVKVHRVPCVAYLSGRVGRCLSYVSFLLSCLCKGLLIRDIDVIVTMTTPPLLSLVGTVLQNSRGMRHFIWVMDLFPEALVDVGIVRRSSPLIRILHSLCDWSYQHADGIISIGECMRLRLLERNIPKEKLHVAENWADGREIFPIPRRREGPLVIMYSGNLGLSHDVETLMFAIQTLKDDRRFRFRFVGSGQRQKDIQELCRAKSIKNVDFVPYCVRSRLAESLSEGDIGLVTLRSTSGGSVVPSKVYGLMAAGRPLLYIGPHGTTPSWIIGRFSCGWHVNCGEGSQLVQLLQTLHSRPDLVELAGLQSRKAFLDHYDLMQGVSRFCSFIGAQRGDPAVAARMISNREQSSPRCERVLPTQRT